MASRPIYPISVSEKPCSKCGRILEASKFNRAKWLVTGLRSDCKECYSLAKKSAWARRPKSEFSRRKAENVLLSRVGMRKCATCRDVFSATSEHFAEMRGYFSATCRPCDRRRVLAWASENSDHARASAAKRWADRRAAKLRRAIRLAPAHVEAMRAIYRRCKLLNRERPRVWHVDHIVPLQGKLVCGLHVPWNLRIVPAADNVRKSNKLISENCWSDAEIAGFGSSR